MQTELEVKFLDIDPEKLRQLLQENGATLVHAERLMRRKTMDYPDRRLEKTGGWVRVRDEGDKITFSYKRVVDRGIEGTKEISVLVDDFEKSCAILEAVGFEVKSYQETKRERWDLDGVEVTIDTWPWIPTFVELEGLTEEALKTAAGKLGLSWNEANFSSVDYAFQKYYDISIAEINNTKIVTFTDAPAWLEAKRR